MTIDIKKVWKEIEKRMFGFFMSAAIVILCAWIVIGIITSKEMIEQSIWMPVLAIELVMLGAIIEVARLRRILKKFERDHPEVIKEIA